LREAYPRLAASEMLALFASRAVPDSGWVGVGEAAVRARRDARARNFMLSASTIIIGRDG
jgi:hypothetical protein